MDLIGSQIGQRSIEWCFGMIKNQKDEMKKDSIFRKVLVQAEKAGYIVNIEEGEVSREVWLNIKGQKFLYKSWKVFPDVNEWIEAIYLILGGGRMELLSDTQVNSLYRDFVNANDIFNF